MTPSGQAVFQLDPMAEKRIEQLLAAPIETPVLAAYSDYFIRQVEPTVIKSVLVSEAEFEALEHLCQYVDAQSFVSFGFWLQANTGLFTDAHLLPILRTALGKIGSLYTLYESLLDLTKDAARKDLFGRAAHHTSAAYRDIVLHTFLTLVRPELSLESHERLLLAASFETLRLVYGVDCRAGGFEALYAWRESLYWYLRGIQQAHLGKLAASSVQNIARRKRA